MCKSLRGEAGKIVKNKFKTVFQNTHLRTINIKTYLKNMSSEEENNELEDENLEELSSDDIVFLSIHLSH